MDKVAARSRAITKKLRGVEELPTNPKPLLSEPEDNGPLEGDALSSPVD